MRTINNLKQEILKFQSISLEEMSGVSLMDRFDTKYLVPIGDLALILQQAHSHYSVLEIKDRRIFKYDTLYYDTPGLQFYNFHHSGKSDRYKIRFRNYVESHLSFFEVKHKNNKGKTFKTRIQLPTGFSKYLSSSMSDFLSVSTPYSPDNLVNTLRVLYERITLVNKTSKERVTIDLNLNFEHEEQKAGYPGIAIFEIKQEKLRGSEMVNILKKHHIRPGSISKYCLGVISTHEHIKQNRFKNQLQQIVKLNNSIPL